MTAITRRSFVTKSAFIGGAGAAGLLVGREPADATTTPTTTSSLPTFGPVVVGAGDDRYRQLTTAYNNRWVANPSSVVLVGSTDQVVSAVQSAVRAGRRISVRGGGHCYANFVYNNSVDVIIDLSLMNNVYFDPSRKAFVVEGGAVLGDIYETLYRGYGVTIPGGHCPSTGIGGHATGGGQGLLSREFGLSTDHIAAVEMVVVNKNNNVNVVIAERGGDNSDLWWAVSGGGGGNFGIITKYWFRAPSATGTDPGQQLPRPPKTVLLATPVIPWASLNQSTFTALLTNLGTFFEQNSSPSSPYKALSSILTIGHMSSSQIAVVTHVDATVPNAAQLMADYHAQLTAGTGLSADIPYRNLNWLSAEETINSATPLIETNATLRNAVKSAYLNKGLNADQIGAIYTNMTRTDYSNPFPALLQIGAMAGGAISAIGPADTAITFRSAVLRAFFNVYWPDSSGDASNIGWIRDIYSQVFASTGGFPVPNDAYAGATINLPDADILDPALNPTGIPWQTLYYGSNYPRLQQVKAMWDPTNFFQHPMSITAS